MFPQRSREREGHPSFQQLSDPRPGSIDRTVQLPAGKRLPLRGALGVNNITTLVHDRVQIQPGAEKLSGAA